MIYTADACSVCVIKLKSLRKELCVGCYDIINEVKLYLHRAHDYKPKKVVK